MRGYYPSFYAPKGVLWLEEPLFDGDGWIVPAALNGV